MIKGVNRQMIEVTHTGSPYFERAFLVVRGGSAPSSEEGLHRLAEKVVRQAETYAGLRLQRRQRRLRRAALCLGCAGGGAALFWVIQQILG